MYCNDDGLVFYSYYSIMTLLIRQKIKIKKLKNNLREEKRGDDRNLKVAGSGERKGSSESERMELRYSESFNIMMESGWVGLGWAGCLGLMRPGPWVDNTEWVLIAYGQLQFINV